MPQSPVIIQMTVVDVLLRSKLPLLLLILLISSAEAATLPLPPNGTDLIGELRQLQSKYEDTFSDIARAHDLGYLEMTQANPAVDPWLPGTGTPITIPSEFILPPGPRSGIVINLAELRLYYYPPDQAVVITHPLGIGREGWETPTGKSSIRRKRINPAWRPPESIRQEYAAQGKSLPDVVPPGPTNPLGSHALDLTMPGYLIHGTHKPYGVGMRVSHGCIRLYPEDIRSLFEQVPTGTPVQIIDQPFKAGLKDGTLYIEAHPASDTEASTNLTPLVSAIVNLQTDQPLSVNWQRVKEVAKQRLGIPVAVGHVTPETSVTE